MGKSQRSKGAAAERELAAELSRLLGVEVKRKLGAAREGGSDIDIPGFSIECKRQETTSPEAWMRQAESNAAPGLVPLVAYRVSRSKWRVIANLEDMVKWLETRNVRDIGVEQHSREIGARFAELEQDAARWRWWRKQRSAALVARTPQQADALADHFIEEGKE